MVDMIILNVIGSFKGYFDGTFLYLRPIIDLKIQVM
jgi:hypothetical protein